jgi:hypothetical protein
VLKQIVLDEYILTVLMRDLVGHDHSPSGFLVYLHLLGETKRLRISRVRASYQTIAEATGLSKSAAQVAVRGLVDRQLLSVNKDSPTATPEYRVLRPWRR